MQMRTVDHTAAARRCRMMECDRLGTREGGGCCDRDQCEGRNRERVVGAEPGIVEDL